MEKQVGDVLDDWLKSVGYEGKSRGSMAGIYPDDVVKLKEAVEEVMRKTVEAVRREQIAQRVTGSDGLMGMFERIRSEVWNHAYSSVDFETHLVVQPGVAHRMTRELSYGMPVMAATQGMILHHHGDIMGVSLWSK